uniref:Interleukin 16 n=1 Tax=Felis catus TaxID=9685 RepID=A0ABI7ZVK1_FELCA
MCHSCKRPAGPSTDSTEGSEPSALLNPTGSQLFHPVSETHSLSPGPEVPRCLCPGKCTAGRDKAVAKPSPASARQPRAAGQEKTQGSAAASLRMDPHGRAGRSRKSTKLRSVSRSLMLCHAKTSDDGSSPDEKYPDPFEMPLGQGRERIFHSSVQLADTSEAGPGSLPDLTPASEAAQLHAAGGDRGKNCRRMLFLKVSRPCGRMISSGREEARPGSRAGRDCPPGTRIRC